MKTFAKILIAIVVVLFVLSFFKDMIIKSIVEAKASEVLGAPVHIGGMSVGLMKQSVRIKDFVVGNPAGFPGNKMLEITEAGVDYDLAAILKGNLHLPKVILKLKNLNVVRNKEGKLNVDALKVVQKKEEAKPTAKKGPNNMPMALDTVVLDLGQVSVTDYTKDPPNIVAHDIGVHEKTYHNIKSAQQLATLVLVEAMGPTALRNAAIYGAASLLGVAFLPAGVAGVLLGKDSSVHEFNSGFDQVFQAALDVVKKGGTVELENKSGGVIKGNMDGANVTIEIVRGPSQTQVKVSARKMFLPKPEIASGVVYQISQKVK